LCTSFLLPCTTKADISSFITNSCANFNRAIVRHTRKIPSTHKVAIHTIKDEGGFPRSLALMVHASTGEIMVKGNVSQSIETSFMLPLMVMFRLLGSRPTKISSMRSVAMAEVLGDDLIHESLRPRCSAMDVGYSREAAMTRFFHLEE
jgi:acid phosphatase family membrane protein YuiD